MRRLWLLLLAAGIAAADQATKALALAGLEAGRSVPVIPGFFDLTLAFNSGAAFSSFANWQHAPLLLMAASGLAILVAGWLMLTIRDNGLLAAALALILGGAAGNLIDRARLGSVVDFVDLYHGVWHFPVFNLADSAITVGGVAAAIMLLKNKG